MLILTRRAEEEIIIGRGPNRVVVTFLGFKGGQGRIGISAPLDVEVDRAEIRARKDADTADVTEQARIDALCGIHGQDQPD